MDATSVTAARLESSLPVAMPLCTQLPSVRGSSTVIVGTNDPLNVDASPVAESEIMMWYWPDLVSSPNFTNVQPAFDEIAPDASVLTVGKAVQSSRS